MDVREQLKRLVRIQQLVMEIQAARARVESGPAKIEEIIESFVAWLPFGSEAAGTEGLHMGGLVDPLTAVSLFFVALASLMIFIYSVGYSNSNMKPDAHDKPAFRRTEAASRCTAASLPSSRCLRARC